MNAKTWIARGSMIGVAMVACAALVGCKEPAPPVEIRAEPMLTSAPAPAISAGSVTSVTPVLPAKSPKPAHPGVASVTARAPEGSLSVRRLVVTHAVKNREPVESDQPFRVSGKKVYAFVEIDNHGHAPGEIRVEFEPPAGEPAHGDVSLAVGDGAHWRTWAYTRATHTPGTWRVVVKSPKGEVLATTSFEVVS